MGLRELTQSKHVEAEQHEFVKILLSGKVSTSLYSNFLFNTMLCYSALELQAKKLNLLQQFPDISRTEHMLFDLSHIDKHTVLVVLPATDEYCKYVRSIENPQQLMAHIYVRHMGDMYGGQLMKKVVPEPATMYNFNDRVELIKKVREHLSDEMADESNLVFDYVIKTFTELLMFNVGLEMVQAES